MANTENKVQFGLKNVHYAKKTGDIWETPVNIPGAVNLSLEPQGEMKPFYADDLAFYVTNTNTGYSGDLEVARFPDQMLQDIWGYKLDETDFVMIEDANAEAAEFALLFQISGDTTNQCYVMFSCTAKRPGVSGQTKEDTTTPTTQKTTITAVPLQDGRVYGRTTHQTPQEIRDGWFTAVYSGKKAQ